MAATANIFTQVYDKIWTVLDADTALTTFMGNGKKFKHTSFNDIATRLTPSDCPALIVRPSQVGFSLPNVKEQKWPFAVEIEFADHREEWKYLMEFYCRIIGALMTSLYGNLGLAYVRLWEISEVKLRPGFFGEADGDKWAAWIGELTITFNLFRDARSSGLFTVDS